MKVGDKVRFVKHHEGFKHDNHNSGLVIGEIYEVEDIGVDGTPYINNGCCTFDDEIELIIETDKHYNNEIGSLYLFAQQHDLNAWEFDIIKRITRCRKKGQFTEDLEKTKRVIDLYLKEYDTKADSES